MMDRLAAILADHGIKSRKFLLTLIAIGVLLVGWLIAGHWSTLAPLFGEFVGGVVALVTVYLGGNVAARHSALSKIPPKDPQDGAS